MRTLTSKVDYSNKLVNSRSLAVENLRGLAAVLVAFGHLYYAFFSLPDMQIAVGSVANLVMDPNNKMPHFWNYIPRSAIWVNVFFLISGLVIQISMERLNTGAFYIQRCFRIFPIFWISVSVQLLIDKFIFARSHTDIIGAYFLQSDKILAVAWTLIIEVRFYILIGILAAFTKCLWNRITAIHVLFLLECLCQSKMGFELIPLGQAYFFCYMSLGMAFYGLNRTCNSDDKNAKRNFAIVGIATFFEFALSRHMGCFTDNDEVAFPSAALIFFICVLIFNDIRIKVLSWLGRISYSLYCLHFPVGWLVTYFLRTRFGISSTTSVIISLFVVLLLSWISALYIEEPLNKIGKKFSKIFQYHGKKDNLVKC